MKAYAIPQSLMFAGAMIVLALALSWAGKAGVFGADAPGRIAMILTGLSLAYYGNGILKAVLRAQAALAARRIAGWSFTLAGLGVAALWAFAPQGLAFTGTLVVTGLALAATLAACVSARTRAPG